MGNEFVGLFRSLQLSAMLTRISDILLQLPQIPDWLISSVLWSDSHKSSPARRQGQFDYSLFLGGPLRGSSIEEFEFTRSDK